MNEPHERKVKGEKILSGEFIIQGIGVLISWNAIITALDWYNNCFPNNNPAFWLPLLNYLPALVFQPLTIVYGHKFRFNTRIIPSYIANGLILGLTPVIATFTSETTGFIIISICTFISGVANAVCETSLFGLVGILPYKYTNYVMFGVGICGFSITCIRLICLGIFPLNSSGYLYSTEVYFAISGGIMILCILAQIHIMKNKFIKECLKKTNTMEGTKEIEEKEKEKIKENEKEKIKGKIKEKCNIQGEEKINYIELLKKIWQYCFLVWVTLLVTFGVLSHVFFATEIR